VTNIKTLKIGTRGSPLALWQAKEVAARLEKAWPELRTELEIIKTSGDWAPRDGETRLAVQAGGKRLFATEIEAALERGDVDIAVHSSKDLDSTLPDGMEIACVLPREDARDAILLRDRSMRDVAVKDWPEGFVVGTASVRRGAMLLALNPGLKIVPLRGNVETRISKLRGALSGEHNIDATLLAEAGLKRLGYADEIDRVLSVDEALPAAGQGTVAIEVLSKNSQLKALLGPICCTQSLHRLFAERAALAVLDGSCHTPIGAYASYDGQGEMHLRLAVYSLDGQQSFFENDKAVILDEKSALEFGANLARKLKEKVPVEMFEQIVSGEGVQCVS
jgi:hydroxymethylbilane synthase